MEPWLLVVVGISYPWVDPALSVYFLIIARSDEPVSISFGEVFILIHENLLLDEESGAPLSVDYWGF